jgi:quinol monooxygenase YgiN
MTMHLRVTRVGGTPEGVSRMISTFEESISAVRRLPGCAGVVLAADAAAGRAFAAGYWESEEALEASETAVSGVRSRIADESGVEVVGVERYEVALIRRAHPLTAGTPARIITATLRPGAIAGLESELENILPVITALPGFRSAVCAFDRRSGSVFFASSWTTAADREASEATLAPMRQRLLGDVTGTAEVVHCDIVFADAPVPASQG